MHDLPLITTIASAFTAAWILGLITQRLRLSPIVGYLLAGILIGPHTPGFVGDTFLAQQMAEVGVILLMFGVGLHFRLKDLLAVKDVAILGATGQSLVATIVSILVFTWLGLPVKSGAVLGMALAVASTVVLMRVLMDASLLDTPQGHVAVGWLIVEDLFTVVLLVLIPVLGSQVQAGPSGTVATSGSGFLPTLGFALLKIGVLIAIVILALSRIVPRILTHVARLRSRELFTLTILVISITVAAGSSMFFGASMALGAFIAGIVVAQSPVGNQAAGEILPMRDAFAVLFFVSVGMLFDPGFALREPLMIAGALGIILLVKPLAALTIVALLGHSARTALTVAFGLAQIGEFSFILSELAHKHGLMNESGHNAVVAGAIISISINPTLFRQIPRVEAFLRRHRSLWRLLNGRAERRAAASNVGAIAVGTTSLAPATESRVVVVGYGPVGRSVHRLLREAGFSTVVIDFNVDTVLALRRDGQDAVFGDVLNESIMEGAGVREASHVILALPHSSDRAAIVTQVRNLNSRARILVRAHYLAEREALDRAGATAAVFEEAEAAVALARLVLADTGVHREAAERKIGDLRLQLIMENITHIREQRVRGVMVPWSRVRWLPTSATKHEVLTQAAGERFSRWPVVSSQTGHAVGYLLTKDLIADTSESNWLRLMRPMGEIAPDANVEFALARMQEEGATVYVVQDDGKPIGFITLEDILEQVVGRIEDEYPHEPEISLQRAVAAGGIVLQLEATTHDDAIRELVAAIPRPQLPPGVDHAMIVRSTLAREKELSTDLGNGVAIPHARCENLPSPLAVIGRSAEGIVFSTAAPEPVHLFFLLITPAERPELQITLLGQLAGLIRDRRVRDALRAATSPVEVMEVLSAPVH
jgi:CPA2 family monovalent cation:H+ antiporter-2